MRNIDLTYLVVFAILGIMLAIILSYLIPIISHEIALIEMDCIVAQNMTEGYDKYC